MENREITAEIELQNREIYISKLESRTKFYNHKLKTLTKQVEELQREMETLKKNRTRDRSLYCDGL